MIRASASEAIWMMRLRGGAEKRNPRDRRRKAHPFAALKTRKEGTTLE